MAAAGEERPVPVDHFLGVDGLVAHGRVDVGVPGDELGDVRRHAVQDRVGDEQAPEVVEGVAQRATGGVADTDRGEGVIEVAAQRCLGDGAVLEPLVVLEQQRHRRVVDPFALVVADDQRHRGPLATDTGDDGGEHVGQFRGDHQ